MRSPVVHSVSRTKSRNVPVVLGVSDTTPCPETSNSVKSISASVPVMVFAPTLRAFVISGSDASIASTVVPPSS